MKRLMYALVLILLTCNVWAARPSPIPASAAVGTFSPSALPNIVINGNTMPTTPALLIYGPNNLLVLSASLTGSPDLIVQYTLDMSGQVNKIWILTRDEVNALPAQPARIVSPHYQ
jgi:hypothetical protein